MFKLKFTFTEDTKKMKCKLAKYYTTYKTNNVIVSTLINTGTIVNVVHFMLCTIHLILNNPKMIIIIYKLQNKN